MIDPAEEAFAAAILGSMGSSMSHLDKTVTDAFKPSIAAAMAHLEKELPKPLQVVALAGVIALYEAKSIGLRTAMNMGEEARDLIHEMGMVDASSLTTVLRGPA